MAARRLTSRSEINSNKELLIKDLLRIYVRKYLAENGLINFDNKKENIEENVEENINIENNGETKKKKGARHGNVGLGDPNRTPSNENGGKV